MNSDAASAREQSEKLAAQGCTVRCLASGDDLVAQVAENADEVLVLHAPAFGEAGPSLVARLNASAPELKIIVIASPGCTLEAAYRSRKIFYYAVEPFADNEIADILDAAFRPHEAPKPPRRARSCRQRASRAHHHDEPQRHEGRTARRPRLAAARRRAWAASSAAICSTG